MDINLNLYSGGDEAKLEQVDNRIKVDDFNKYPFGAVGKIIAYFDSIIEGKLKQVMKSGTGTLISEKVVLTCAHIFYLKDGTKATKVQFYPFCQQKSNDSQLKHVKVKQFYIHPFYTGINHDHSQRYDMCLMILENNNLIKYNSPIKLKFDYAKWKQPEDPVMVVGYPSDLQKSKRIQSVQNHLLFQESRTPSEQKQPFLYYRHSTSEANSGGPIFVIQDKKYEIIGIHKARLAIKNYGLLINDMPNTKQILSELIEMNNLEGMMGEIYQPTYKTLLQSEKKLRDQNQKLKKENQHLKQQIQSINQQYEGNHVSLLKEKPAPSSKSFGQPENQSRLMSQRFNLFNPFTIRRIGGIFQFLADLERISSSIHSQQQQISQLKLQQQQLNQKIIVKCSGILFSYLFDKILGHWLS